MKNIKLLLSKPRGFCAGVVRAIDTVEKALELFGAPIYVKHQIVHNEHVVKRLEEKGAIFIEEIEEVPLGATLIYSAHGVSPEVKAKAKKRGLKEIDATCSLVTRIHSAVTRYSLKGYFIILIGHKNHVETIGTFGHAPEQTTIIETPEEVDGLHFSAQDKLFYITQTTLSVEDVKAVVCKLVEKYPQIETLPTSSICFATTNRQYALKQIAHVADLILVVGDERSSNSNRLVELGRSIGKKSHLIHSASEIDPSWLENCGTVGLSAGASTPEDVVVSCIDYLKSQAMIDIEEIELVKEEVFFQLPKQVLKN